MAGSSLFTLIDDIASVLDDVALLTKVAAKKTSGVLGDDLALNAQQVVGVSANRELPVIWAVAKGSAVNKLILVPLALIISSLTPKLITPLLMLGGIYLCFEGAEKVIHFFFHKKSEENSHHQEHLEHLTLSPENLLEFEKEKIQGAIKTDFVLSAEIITITLGSVALAPVGTQVAVLFGISVLMTVGVYGLVAGIVKIDDLGFYLIHHPLAQNPHSFLRAIGLWLLKIMPYFMKALSVIGTLAMFLVGGGILTHALHFQLVLPQTPWANPLNALTDGVVGFLTGAAFALGFSTFKKVFKQ